MMDYYELLGITRWIDDPGQIKAAYRKAVKYFHPDSHNVPAEEAERQMWLLNDAYAILSNPQKKAAYDSLLEWEQEEVLCQEEPAEKNDQNQFGSNLEEYSSEKEEDRKNGSLHTDEPSDGVYQMPGWKLILYPSVMGLCFTILIIAEVLMTRGSMTWMDVMYLLIHFIACLLGIIFGNNRERIGLLQTAAVIDLVAFLAIVIVGKVLQHPGFANILYVTAGITPRILCLLGIRKNRILWNLLSRGS